MELILGALESDLIEIFIIEDFCEKQWENFTLK